MPASRFGVAILGVALVCLCLVEPVPHLLAAENPEEQGAGETDPWAPFRLLVGTWEGAIDGRLGQGVGRRQYQFILDGKFLLSRHSSIRLPQEKSPRGDHHRELGVFSLDRARGTIVFRQFLVEGFVNQYACEVDPERIVCTTESVENGAGMRARDTIEIEDRFHFVETFELASPGQELTVYFTNRWTRTPTLED
jgi:hypothetical protein